MSRWWKHIETAEITPPSLPQRNSFSYLNCSQNFRVKCEAQKQEGKTEAGVKATLHRSLILGNRPDGLCGHQPESVCGLRERVCPMVTCEPRPHHDSSKETGSILVSGDHYLMLEQVLHVTRQPLPCLEFCGQQEPSWRFPHTPMVF